VLRKIFRLIFLHLCMCMDFSPLVVSYEDRPLAAKGSIFLYQDSCRTSDFLSLPKNDCQQTNCSQKPFLPSVNLCSNTRYLFWTINIARAHVGRSEERRRHGGRRERQRQPPVEAPDLDGVSVAPALEIEAVPLGGNQADV
jgi:hypothetical protein